MEKELKDYLPLYIGQKAQIIKGRWKDVVGTIRGFDSGVEDCIMLSDCNTNFKPDEDFIEDCRPCTITEFSLLLRPLSDMSEEEASEIYDIIYPHVGDDRSQNKKAFVIREYCHGKGIYDEGNQSLRDALPYFTILLSRGFDLFGLIDSGLAINQSVVKR